MYQRHNDQSQSEKKRHRRTGQLLFCIPPMEGMPEKEAEKVRKLEQSHRIFILLVLFCLGLFNVFKAKSTKFAIMMNLSFFSPKFDLRKSIIKDLAYYNSASLQLRKIFNSSLSCLLDHQTTKKVVLWRFLYLQNTHPNHFTCGR